MLFKRLRYRTYRNLEKVEFEPGPGFNVFWGKNGQGKTNLLEGIYLLGHLKSFRSALTETMISEQSQEAAIESELLSGSVVHRIDLSMNRQGKDIRLDGKRPQRIAEIAEKLRQVLFSPEEVATVKGAPGLRRNLVDRAIFQLQPSYLERMQNYYRVLKQRNQLLKNGRSDAETDVWKESLIEEGARIRASRNRFCRQLQPYFEKCYGWLSSDQEHPEIKLKNDQLVKMEEYQQALREELDKYRDQEKMRRTTLAGPHRDAPHFYVNGQELRGYGSQGQQRTFVLSFKIALLNLLKDQFGRTAVLMLDDITSELDEQRREALFSMLHEGAGQVFVTTTDPGLITTNTKNICQLFEVRQGQVYASSTTKR